MQITMAQAYELTMDVLTAKHVPFLTSSPAVGKSSIGKQIAEDNNLALIDIRLSQMEPNDLLGFPQIRGDKAGYIPMDTFPVEGDPLPEGKDGWLCFFDEFNSAAPAVAAAAYKIILDKQIGQYKLHDRVAVMAAGNLSTDKAIVNRMSTAMQSRLIHLEILVDPKAWIAWADNHAIDHRVKSFINFKPGALHKFDPNHNEHTFPAPRTWEFVSDLIKPLETIPYNKLPLLAGAIGEGMAREFHSFCEVFKDLPTLREIEKDPAGVRINTEPSVQHALVGMISQYMNKHNAEAMMIFLNRLSIDFQVIGLRSILSRDVSMKDLEPVKEWVKLNSRELTSVA